MGDYRDDRGALRQRVEELESELERAQRANAELEAELQREREPKPSEKPKKPKPGRKPPTVLILGAVVGVVGVWGVWGIVAAVSDTPDPARYPEPDELNPRSYPPPESNDWGDRAGDIPTDDSEPWANTAPSIDSPFVESRSCRCEWMGLNSAGTLAYRAVTPADASPTVIEAALVGPRKVELRLTTETAPPSSLTPKKTRLLVACDNHYMVLAFGERAVAWSRATGDAMWIATLPAAVGGIEPGPFELECETLPITAGTITLKHANGSTRLSMKDGEPVEH